MKIRADESGTASFAVNQAKLDWLTVSTRNGVFVDALKKRFSFDGREGTYAGNSGGYYGGVFVGRIRGHGNGWVLVGSGAENSSRLARFIWAVGAKPKATRLDIQITVLNDGLDFAATCAQLRSAGMRVRHIDGDGADGSTLEIGSRSSERFLRIYQRDIIDESECVIEEYIRVELELKGGMAAQSLDEAVGDGAAYRLASELAWLFRDKSACHPSLRRLLSRVTDCLPPAGKRLAYTKRHASKRQAWLRGQVRAAVLNEAAAGEEERKWLLRWVRKLESDIVNLEIDSMV